MDISFVQKEDEITILYTGDGFLQNMIRILTGTLIEVGRKERSPESMKALLEAKSGNWPATPRHRRDYDWNR